MKSINDLIWNPNQDQNKENDENSDSPIVVTPNVKGDKTPSLILPPLPFCHVVFKVRLNACGDGGTFT